MTPPRPLTRRAALKTAAVGVLALPLARFDARGAETPAAPAPSTKPSADGREHGLRLGVATYSTRMLSVEDTISALKALRIANAGVFRLHMPWAGTADECREVAAKFRAAGIAITGSGVINLPNDESALRKAFDNAAAVGLRTMVCKPELAALPLVEKFVRQYDQKLAIHNHGPEDAVYPTAEKAWEAIKSLDARIGLCIDVGHSARAGSDPVAEIKRYASRVYDIHLKDSIAIVGARSDVPVEAGVGHIDLRGILRALREANYDGVVTYEYEKGGGNPVVGLAESLGYVRGLLKAMS